MFVVTEFRVKHTKKKINRDEKKYVYAHMHTCIYTYFHKILKCNTTTKMKLVIYRRKDNDRNDFVSLDGLNYIN